MLVLRVINADLKDAVCGSPTKCAIANAIRRTVTDPQPTFVKVSENRITITWHSMLHHYELTRPALKMVAQNDDGSLTLAPDISHTVRLPRVRVRAAYVDLTPARRQQIKDAESAIRKARAEAGLPPRKYQKNTRLLAAKSAGVALKKLHTVSHRAAATA
jgi:hypothetical protein